MPAPAQKQSEEIFKQAQAAHSRSDLADAQRKYLELIRQSPEAVAAYSNLGIVYLEDHKYAEAVQVLQKAVTLAPKLPGTWFLKGLAHYELYQSRKAVEAFETAVRLDPSDHNAQLYLGKAQIQMRDYEGAAQTLEKLSVSMPNNASVLYNLGLAHMKLTLDDVNRLASAAPHSYLLLLLLAQDAETWGDENAAARFYRQALAVNPHAAGVHYALGSIYANAGKYPAASLEFQEELKINTHDPLALWKLGALTLRTDPANPGRACDYLQRALALNPELVEARLAYGQALLQLGDTNESLKQFQQAERLAPEDDAVHYHLASLYRKLKRSELASAEMAKFQELANKKNTSTNTAAKWEFELLHDSQQSPQPDLDPSPDVAHR